MLSPRLPRRVAQSSNYCRPVGCLSDDRISSFDGHRFYYFSQGVMILLLSVCLSVCYHDNSKSCRRIVFIFFLSVWVLLPFDGEIKMYIVMRCISRLATVGQISMMITMRLQSLHAVLKRIFTAMRYMGQCWIVLKAGSPVLAQVSQ